MSWVFENDWLVLLLGELGFNGFKLVVEEKLSQVCSEAFDEPVFVVEENAMGEKVVASFC
jgi:hypothetical protein